MLKGGRSGGMQLNNTSIPLTDRNPALEATKRLAALATSA